MSYSDFTVKMVVDLLGYQVEWRPFLASLRSLPQQPSDKLLGALDLFRTTLVLHSEMSRNLSLVGPILSEAAAQSHTKLFAGESFDVEAKSGLAGVVDFVFAAREQPVATIVRPILCVVEAKRADIDTHAIGQCVAAMIAAQRTNGDGEPVYGCVTTGNNWQFLRLVDKLAEVEPTLHYDNELPAILGILLAFLRRGGPAAS